MKIPIQNSLFFIFLAILSTSCVKDEIALPPLNCTQPDLTVNRTVAEVRKGADPVVAQYKFDDIIEAYA